MKCNHCGKHFLGEQFLRKHYAKKHPEKNYDVDYPSKAQVDKQKEASQKEVLDQQRKDQEKLFLKMKNDLIQNLNGSIGTLEKEVLQIKSEQSKLESIGKTSEIEQKRIDQSLAHSSELLREYKQQWNQQLESHQQRMNELVAKTVNDALMKRKDE